jgi:hypothetical protein
MLECLMRIIIYADCSVFIVMPRVVKLYRIFLGLLQRFVLFVVGSLENNGHEYFAKFVFFLCFSESFEERREKTIKIERLRIGKNDFIG